jgi:hypothetical protein
MNSRRLGFDYAGKAIKRGDNIKCYINDAKYARIEKLGAFYFLTTCLYLHLLLLLTFPCGPNYYVSLVFTAHSSMVDNNFFDITSQS